MATSFEITEDMKRLHRVYLTILARYPCNSGAYDRSHSDNVKLGIRHHKLCRLIESQGEKAYLGIMWVALAVDKEDEIIPDPRFVNGCECRLVISGDIGLIAGESDCPVHGFGNCPH